MHKLIKNFTAKRKLKLNEWEITTYPSISSFLKRLKRDENISTNKYSSHNGSYDFSQTNSFDDALKILETGSKEILDGLKDATKHAISELQKELNTMPDTYIADVHGLFFDIAKVIEGEPECWYRDAWDKEKKPRIYVPLMGSYNAGFDSKKAIKNASKIIALIKALEDKGIEVELDMVFMAYNKCFSGDKKHGFCSVTVKSYDENFNFTKLSAMLHPSFFRRLMFREDELQFPQNLDGGYGQTATPDTLFEEGHSMLQIQNANSIEKFKHEALQLLKAK